MEKYLFEDLTNKLQGIANGFLFSRARNIEAKQAYDCCKDAVVDNFGSDAEIIMSPSCRIQIATACKDTIDWRTAFVNLAAIMASTDDEQKQATKGCTNGVTATTIRVIEPKARKPKKGGR
jgi:hypothetical protein